MCLHIEDRLFWAQTHAHVHGIWVGVTGSQVECAPASIFGSNPARRGSFFPCAAPLFYIAFLYRNSSSSHYTCSYERCKSLLPFLPLSECIPWLPSRIFLMHIMPKRHKLRAKGMRMHAKFVHTTKCIPHQNIIWPKSSALAHSNKIGRTFSLIIAKHLNDTPVRTVHRMIASRSSCFECFCRAS